MTEDDVLGLQEKIENKARKRLGKTVSLTVFEFGYIGFKLRKKGATKCQMIYFTVRRKRKKNHLILATTSRF